MRKLSECITNINTDIAIKTDKIMLFIRCFDKSRDIFLSIILLNFNLPTFYYQAFRIY